MAQVQNMSVTEVSYSVDKPRNRIFNSRDLEYGEIDTPIGIDPAWGTGNSTSRSQKSPLSEMNCYQTVLSLASQGTDPEDISLRTGLEREAIRILLANNQQIINKEKDHQYMNIR
jgi:hypothetical protein